MIILCGILILLTYAFSVVTNEQVKMEQELEAENNN